MSSDIIDELFDRIRDELAEVDADKAYDEFLNECYSFRSIGGPFEYMLPSKVLEEMDPTVYRCGFNDWLDGEDLIDIGGGNCEYYRRDQMEEVRDAFVGELEGERDSLQEELEEYEDQRAELESDEDEAIGKSESNIEITQQEINALQAKIDQLTKYVF